MTIAEELDRSIAADKARSSTSKETPVPVPPQQETQTKEEDEAAKRQGLEQPPEEIITGFEWILDIERTVEGCQCKELIRRRIAHMYAFYYDRCNVCRCYLKGLHEYVIHHKRPELIRRKIGDCCDVAWSSIIVDHFKKDITKRAKLGNRCEECTQKITTLTSWIQTSFV